MYDKCFERVEEKYLLSEEQKQKFLAEVDKYIAKDKHFRSFMRNVYFDTQDFDLISRAIDKPIFKDKFRVRSYEDPAKSDEVFLEMKMKYKGVSHKRRTKLSFNEYKAYIKDGKHDSANMIWSEIDYYFKFYGLCSMVYIAYDRESYCGIDNKGLRITFDANLRSRFSNVTLADDTHTEQFFDEPIYIMEIKTAAALPLWLVRALLKFDIMPTSFSKYGRIYTKMLTSKKKG